MATIKLADIRARKRCRQDLGDVASLAGSIADIGLLQPIVLDKDGYLIAGKRRIEAFKKLGRDSIPYVTATNLSDALGYLRAERDENTCRKDFLVSEAVVLGQRLEDLERKAAKERQKQSEGRGKKVRKVSLPIQSRDAVGKAVGLSGRTYEKAKAVIESGDEKLIADMDRSGKVNGVFKRLKVSRQAEQIAAEPPPLPTGKFRVIVADPPWHYEKRANDDTHRASLPYPSMSIDQIAEMNVASRAHEDSILWLWVTNAHLPEVWAIVSAWGFQYKTMLTWAKHKMGTGDWLRGKTEHCLMCVRGKPTIKLTNQTTLLDAAAGAHSAKPDAFYDLVEALCPGSKLELFSRRPREGWTAYGDEVHADK